MNETPLLRQLLICEKVIVEQHTEFVSLFNCHTVRRIERFPSPRLDFAIYGLLTNGFGRFTMEAKVWSLESGDEIVQHVIPADFPDRLLAADCVFKFKNVVFPAAGDYEIGLFANRDLLATTILNLWEIDQ